MLPIQSNQSTERTAENIDPNFCANNYLWKISFNMRPCKMDSGVSLCPDVQAEPMIPNPHGIEHSFTSTGWSSDLSITLMWRVPASPTNLFWSTVDANDMSALHDEALTKWVTFCRRHFQMNFIGTKRLDAKRRQVQQFSLWLKRRQFCWILIYVVLFEKRILVYMIDGITLSWESRCQRNSLECVFVWI